MIMVEKGDDSVVISQRSKFFVEIVDMVVYPAGVRGQDLENFISRVIEYGRSTASNQSNTELPQKIKLLKEE